MRCSEGCGRRRLRRRPALQRVGDPQQCGQQCWIHGTGGFLVRSGGETYGPRRGAASGRLQLWMPTTMDLLISSAYAQDAAQTAAPNAGLLGGLGQFASILPIVLVFGVFYFLLIRPQQQRQKQLKATLAALRRGDRVVTAGGIIGVVQKVKDGASEIEVEIAAGVRVLVLRDTISSVVSEVPTAANDSVPEKRAAKP